MGKLIDLTGQKFGRLIVIGQAGRDKSGAVLWRCQCDCGNVTITRGRHLTSGAAKSCGCLRNEQLQRMNVERNTTHNGSKTRLYRIWGKMVQRCYNPNNPRYADYGGRGIIICVEWRHDFEAFAKWAYANGYKDHLTIDRIENDGNYEPSNCRWVDRKTQNRNQRTNHLLTYRGETKSLAEWSEQFHINRYTLLKRLKLGWDVKKALETPVNSLKK